MKLPDLSDLVVNQKGELRHEFATHQDGMAIVGLHTWYDNLDSYKRESEKIKRIDFTLLKDTFENH